MRCGGMSLEELTELTIKRRYDTIRYDTMQVHCDAIWNFADKPLSIADKSFRCGHFTRLRN